MGEVREGARPSPGAGFHPDYLTPGTEVNGFRLVRHINSGGYGSVWLAESVHTPGKYYALKFSLHPPGEPRRADERAEREVRLMLQVLHPNVLRVIAHGRWKDPLTGLRYLVMEYVEGATLLEWTRQHNPPLRMLVRLIQTIARALQAAHDAGVVHRDVKPSNVLVREADCWPSSPSSATGMGTHCVPCWSGRWRPERTGTPPSTRPRRPRPRTKPCGRPPCREVARKVGLSKCTFGASFARKKRTPQRSGGMRWCAAEMSCYPPSPGYGRCPGGR